ncbi:MAG: TonB family protein [Candidatus Sulfotelmatobacter sp.]
MAQHPMWRPDSSKPARSDLDPSEAGPAEAVPPGSSGSENSAATRRESDVAELAAKFAAHGGGKIPAELSGELALDIVLNEIVEQACLATGATGAAVALARGEEMVCRASSGDNAPELGTRLDMNSGLSGACMRTRQIQCCDDALSDPSADAAVSRELGVRSVVVLPLLRDEELVGILEILSARPCAFGDRDLRTLEVLAERILKDTQARQSSLVSVGLAATNLAASATPENAVEETKVKGRAEAAADDTRIYDSLGGRRGSETGTEIAPASRFDWLTAAMAVIVCSVAILMGVVFAMRVGWLKASGSHASGAAAAASAFSSTSSTAPAAPVGKEMGAGSAAEETDSTTRATAKNKSASGQAESRMESARIPEGSLRVYEGGKEIFRMPPSGVAATAGSPAEKGATTGLAGPPARIVELSPDAAEGSLVRRVEPEYPQQALAQRVQGPVLLDVRISREGAVQDVRLVSGDPLLADAAIAAVRQWRFKPHTVNGRAVEMETKITLRFTLPAS